MKNLLAPERRLSRRPKNLFIVWTSFWWGGVVVMGTLFFMGTLTFTASTKIALYGISIWLNGCLIGLIGQSNDGRSKMQVYHDSMVLWMITYLITNMT